MFWRSRVELGWVGDRVIESFMKIDEVAFKAGFPFLQTMIYGGAAFQVSLTISAVLGSNDRSGECIRRQMRGVVAHHAAEIGQYMGRNNMLPCGGPHCLQHIAVLYLASHFLSPLIGHQKACKFVSRNQCQPVFLREAALILPGEIPRSRVVGEVLEHRRILIPVGIGTVSPNSRTVLSVFPPAILREQI